ncbi:hypothetical protein [Winogradskyella sp.]|uniref:hypothetical protein n=1 Tax=Winogradskyella sp. TaxID=1883156 RepID=UPI0025DBA816|nr:hypothetical protein [Winogradskyella sp.]MCT4629191.1 hypothetical protein [Winogradskyella sp.]
MKIFKLILLIVFVLPGTIAFAQVNDNEKKSIRIPAEPSKTKKDTLPVKIKVAPKLDKKDDKATGKSKEEKKFIIKKSDRPFSMTDEDGLKSPAEIFEKRWNKDLEKGGVIRTMSDQFLGEHNVDTKFVNIVCRDHEYPDGDRVRIYINGIIVKPNLVLTSSYRRVEVDLIQGKNTIEIEALNQGESGPNTAEFIVYDDQGKVISSKEWNLLTGVKAIIVFNNEKVVIKEKTEEEKKESEGDEASNN